MASKDLYEEKKKEKNLYSTYSTAAPRRQSTQQSSGWSAGQSTPKNSVWNAGQSAPHAQSETVQKPKREKAPSELGEEMVRYMLEDFAAEERAKEKHGRVRLPPGRRPRLLQRLLLPQKIRRPVWAGPRRQTRRLLWAEPRRTIRHLLWRAPRPRPGQASSPKNSRSRRCITWFLRRSTTARRQQNPQRRLPQCQKLYHMPTRQWQCPQSKNAKKRPVSWAMRWWRGCWWKRS